MAQKNWLNGLFKAPKRRQTKTPYPTSTSRSKRRSAGSYIPNALKPKNILTSVVTRSINQVVRKVIGSFFKPK
ncbi:MAG: hypothetical protein LBF38_06790 [Deltaproteobacteria bacterium]|nr:hypothetical protein [Deltaproteobacteria bacterium]